MHETSYLLALEGAGIQIIYAEMWLHDLKKKPVYDTLRLTRSYMLCAVEASIENI
jgi:hypothetical protein